MLEILDNGTGPEPNDPKRRYYSGKNTSKWKATQISGETPGEWTVVTRDMWKEFGDFTLTGIAPTALGGPAWFDKIELLRATPVVLEKVGKAVPTSAWLTFRTGS